MRSLAPLASLAVASALLSTSALAYCPSYTPAQTSGGQRCGVNPVPGANPSVSAWNAIFALVAPGSASWKTSGPPIGTINSGCGKPKPATKVPAHFPCHVLKAIAMQESGWRQFCVPDIPAGSVGAPERTIVSFDCGYGVGQVTSGMHVGETPSFDRGRVASDPTYNLATGTLILAAKWSATNCVGDNDPDVLEDWYTSIWAYNGLAYSNNPNNPNLTPGRGVYKPGNGGSYTYQERILGSMENPPTGRWVPLAPAYPNRGNIGNSGSPPALPEPDCASPTDCVGKRGTHASSCDPVAPGDAGPPPADSGPRPGDAGPEEKDAEVTPPGIPGRTDDGGVADAPASGDSGCSCRASGTGAGSGLGPALLALLGLVIRAARSPRRR